MEAFHQFIENVSEDEKKYYTELSQALSDALENGKPIYATHGSCPDGIIAGMMIKQTIEDAFILYVDYSMMKDDDLVSFLQSIPIRGIVDFRPFNTYTIDFWVDHHRSAIGSEVHAERITFDVDGFSGAWQLYQSHAIPVQRLSDDMMKLIALSRITDTADFREVIALPTDDITYISPKEIGTETGVIPIPSRIVLDEDNNLVTDIGEDTDRETIEQLAHVVIDFLMSASQSSYDEIRKLTRRIINHGIGGILNKSIFMVNIIRRRREIDTEIAEKMITEQRDMYVFISPDRIEAPYTITRYLQSKGVKMVVSLIEKKEGYKISFRRNKVLSKRMREEIQLHSLAEEFGGGGHAGASGAHIEKSELPSFLDRMREYARERDMLYDIYKDL